VASKVSVNICCYNSERFIKETIESVLAQTFNDFEVIIINDGSIDLTEEIIKKFNDSRVHYFYQENKGLSVSRNEAISLSKGEFIALLDHDDLWEPEKLKLQVEFLDKNPAIGIVSSDGYTISEDNKILKRFSKNSRPYRGKVLNQLIKEYWIVCSTVMMRRELLNKSDWFRPDLEIAEEYDLFLRLALITEFDYIDKPLAKYRLHRENKSKDLEKLFRETKVILTDLAEKTDEQNLKICISMRLGELHTELAIIYLLSKQSFLARDEIRMALAKARNKPLVFIIYLCSCLSSGLSQKLIWFLKKSRSVFRKIIIAI